MRKISLLLLLQIVFCAFTKANNISLYSGDIEFDVPNDYVEIAVPKEYGISYYSKSGEKAIALVAYRNSDFDVAMVLEGLDSCLCNLSNYKLVDTEKEYIWNLTTDYITKKYVSESGQKFASYTRYVTKGAYCFGFWYNTEEEYKEFENLIESIHFSEEEGWSQISLIAKYSVWAVILIGILLIIATMFAGAGGSKDFGTSIMSSGLITLIIALLFIIPLWHFWMAYLALLALFFIGCFICAYFGFYLTFDAD